MSEEVAISLGELTVRMRCAGPMDPFVDVAGLLGVEEVPEPPYWMHLWPGAVALARWVLVSACIGPGVRVLELGCGLALPAVVASLRGARVLATDRELEPLALARGSASLNACDLAVMQMNWQSPALRPRFDVCLGAEVAYDQMAEESLVQTLRTSLADGGVAWLADSVNTYRRSLVSRLVAAGFSTRLHDAREEEEGRPVGVRIIEAWRET